MNNSRRILSLLLALVMVFLVACGAPASNNETKNETSGEVTETTSETSSEQGSEKNPQSSEGSEVKEYYFGGSNSLTTMDYLVTSKNADHVWNANFVDGLLEHNRLGKLQGALAESWEVSKDGLTWTFKLRQGVNWVTHNQEIYGEVVAEDFVTGLRHAAEYKSGTGWVVAGIIKGYSEYENSDFSDAAWEKVGVKALDKYTVQYTLEKEAPYFGDITTYAILFPVNREFLESKGAVIGKPDTTGSTFGAPQPDSILYNGGYILQTFDEKSKVEIVKNNNYWDAANVYLEKITEVYDDGSDPYSTKKGFENGTYSAMSMKPTWKDYKEIRAQYEAYVRPNQPNPTVFGMTFNFNRKVYDNSAKTDEADRENTRKALLNENFRKALRASYNRQPVLEVDAPTNIATEAKRNINNFPDAGTTSDGKTYYQLVTEIYNKNTNSNVDLSDGQDPFLSKEEALKYIEAAKAEGIKFPVRLDMLTIETSDRLVKQAFSLSNSIKEGSSENIIVDVVLRSSDEVRALAYNNEDPDAVDFDISTFSGWSPDFNDPKSFADTMSPVGGNYMTNLGLGTKDKDGNILNKELKEQLGFMEYEKLINEADSYTSQADLDKRYQTYAKADSLLLEKALYIPTSMAARAELVSKAVPYSANYSLVGLSSEKYKGLKLRKEALTAEEYYAIRDAWLKEVEEASKH